MGLTLDLSSEAMGVYLKFDTDLWLSANEVVALIENH
jgi:hypothetical protein